MVKNLLWWRGVVLKTACLQIDKSRLESQWQKRNGLSSNFNRVKNRSSWFSNFKLSDFTPSNKIFVLS